MLSLVTIIVVLAALWSGFVVLGALHAIPTLPSRWGLQVAIFVAVATIPHFLVELVAMAAEALTPDLPPKVSTRWFRNIGAFVGVAERPLLLGALVAGYPPFIAAWFVFKGIAGYKLGLESRQLQERRLFQLFLLNNLVSFGGVALAWLAWRLLQLPVLKV